MLWRFNNLEGLFFPGSRARDFACFVVIARKNRKKGSQAKSSEQASLGYITLFR